MWATGFVGGKHLGGLYERCLVDRHRMQRLYSSTCSGSACLKHIRKHESRHIMQSAQCRRNDGAVQYLRR